MKAFHVWISRLDGASGIRVESLENAMWLLCKLSEFFVFKTSEPLQEIANSSDYTFRIAHNSQLSGHRFEKLLAGIVEARVMLEPVTRA
jgi:hypothetical protein